MVAQYRTCFVALENANVTLNIWSEETIQRLLYFNEDFWCTYIGHHQQLQVKQIVLIINFLAGPRFEALAMSSDCQSYEHNCGKVNYRLGTLEEMVHHIEKHHPRQEMVTKIIDLDRSHHLDIEHFHWKIQTLYLSVNSDDISPEALADWISFTFDSSTLLGHRIRLERVRNSGHGHPGTCKSDLMLTSLENRPSGNGVTSGSMPSYDPEQHPDMSLEQIPAGAHHSQSVLSQDFDHSISL